jgi:hypothetical protein
MNVDEALKNADRRGFKAIPLGIRMKGHIPTTVRQIVTKNVIGMVEGTDPALKAEVVVFSAHWDHLGVGRATLGGDNIYNGAADNATGCGILLEMARMWVAHKPRPKRSALFMATTAEESGLLGAAYYAEHPLVPLGKTALNLNFDTVHPLGVPESVVVSGAERTTAWPVVENVARKHKLEIEPDRLAHLGLFYRSDHFAFARGRSAGVLGVSREQDQGQACRLRQEGDRGVFRQRLPHAPRRIPRRLGLLRLSGADALRVRRRPRGRQRRQTADLAAGRRVSRGPGEERGEMTLSSDQPFRRNCRSVAGRIAADRDIRSTKRLPMVERSGRIQLGRWILRTRWGGQRIVERQEADASSRVKR